MNQGRWKWTNILRRSLCSGLCDGIELSLLGCGRDQLLTFTNAVHPTPIMKVCLCFFELAMAVDVDEVTADPAGQRFGDLYM